MRNDFVSTIAILSFLFLTSCNKSNSPDTNTPIIAGADIVNIAYFSGWPTPNLIAKAEGAFAEQMGVATNWVKFEAGTAMADAVDAGTIDIAYSMGKFPFVQRVNAGIAMQTVSVAAQYASSPCIVRTGSGISAANATELQGKNVAVPLDSGAEYSFRRQMASLGIDVSQVNIIDGTSIEASTALANGVVDMACVFGSEATNTALMNGSELLSNEDMVARGIVSFDVTAVRNAFLDANPELVRTFLRVTDEYNNQFQGTQSELDILTVESGPDLADPASVLSGLQFPSASEQVSRYFGDGGLVSLAFDVASPIFATEDGFYLQDYTTVINASFLQ